MRYLSLGEVLELYLQLIEATGGTAGIRDLGMLQSAVAQPRMTFGAGELYSTLVEKAAALGFSLVMNHPMLDGNKRLGHAAMELFLRLNGVEIEAPVDEQERLLLSLAAGEVGRDELVAWLSDHVRPLPQANPGQA